MLDKFHLTFNFKSKVSRDVFKNKNECQLTSTFSSKYHLNATRLVVRVISLMCDFISEVTLHVKFYIVRDN